MIEKAWNWNNISNNYWEIPDEYMYYLVQRWKEQNRTKILDLGCGIGRHSLLFAKNDYDVTAVDISQSGLDKVKSISNEQKLNIKTILANITSLPLQDNEMDSTIAFNSIYHTDKNGFKKAISEMYRILKPNSEAFLTLLSKADPSYENVPQDKIIDKNTIMKKEEDGTELPHFFVDYEEIYEIFKEFQIISIKEITEFFNSKRHVHFNILVRLTSYKKSIEK